MCGIYLSVRSTDGASLESHAEKKRAYRDRAWLRQALVQRGPDQQGSLRWTAHGRRIDALSSVLHIRGDTACAQPVFRASQGRPDALLMWNGEIFGASMSALRGIPETSSDTAVLAQTLFRRLPTRPLDLSSKKQQLQNTAAEESIVVDIFASIEGPFALAFYLVCPPFFPHSHSSKN